jgi:hypothetical protein
VDRKSIFFIPRANNFFVSLFNDIANMSNVVNESENFCSLNYASVKKWRMLDILLRIFISEDLVWNNFLHSCANERNWTLLIKMFFCCNVFSFFTISNWRAIKIKLTSEHFTVNTQMKTYHIARCLFAAATDEIYANLIFCHHWP